MLNKLKSIAVQKKMIESGIAIFSPLEFKRIFDVSEYSTRFYISYNLKTGLFEKLRSGLYFLKSNPPSELEVANRLYRPSYISFEFALSFYHQIPESVYSITSATSKTSRVFSALSKNFIYHKIKKSAFTGYVPQKIGGVTVLLAEPEKAVVDYLYFVALKKKAMLERLNLKNLSRRKILAYAKIFKNNKLNALLKSL